MACEFELDDTLCMYITFLFFLLYYRQGPDGFGAGRGYGRGTAGRMGGRGFGKLYFINYYPKILVETFSNL